MRRLLLLLLTFLLPLQLLAATVVDLQPFGGRDDVASMAADEPSCTPVREVFLVAEAAIVHAAPELEASAIHLKADASDFGTGQNGTEEDVDASPVQAELEDHIIPVRIATPNVPWQPFPHAFLAPLHWPSFVRDQLRPPPLS